MTWYRLRHPSLRRCPRLMREARLSAAISRTDLATDVAGRDELHSGAAPLRHSPRFVVILVTLKLPVIATLSWLLVRDQHAEPVDHGDHLCGGLRDGPEQVGDPLTLRRVAVRPGSIV